jgi:hypothetical protein
MCVFTGVAACLLQTVAPPVLIPPDSAWHQAQLQACCLALLEYLHRPYEILAISASPVHSTACASYLKA